MLNLVDNTFLNNTALINDHGESFKYADINKFSSKLNEHLPKHTLVFSLCSNTIESVFGYCSFIVNKTVPLLLDDNISNASLKNLCQLYRPNYIWLPSSRLDSLDFKANIFTFRNYSLIEFDSSYSHNLDNKLSLLLTTSGSTGSPKLVRLSSENLQSNASSISNYLHLDQSEAPITTLPMSYSFGLSIINSHLINGAKILLTNKSIIQREFWDFLKDREATSLSGVPYTFEMLKKIKFFNMELKSLRTLTQAGGKMHQDLCEQYASHCRANDISFYVMYGQTEATARMSYLPPQDSVEKKGSIGIAIPEGELLIFNKEEEFTEIPNTVGELVYKGKNVSLGYAESITDLSKGDENNGTLMTGDIAYKDKDGYFYIVGRKKRFIKIYGNRVNLDEVEGLLKTITTDVACGGTDDNMVIYITSSDYEKEITTFIKDHTEINLKGFKIKLISEIPKSNSGKIIYSKLSDIYY